MSAFRQRPSHRKQRRPQASWLVLGIKRAPAVARGEITMHVLPAKGVDHRKRYAPGQRLAVKQLVGVPGMGDTLCHVRVFDVQGPCQQMTAGQIGFHEARLLGHRTTGEFRLWWIREYDRSWWEPIRDRLASEGREPDEDTLDEFEARFEHRWASKLVWALRFTVDIAEPARLLAARSEELYTDSQARALADEMPALSAADYDRHVAKRRDMTTEQYIALERETRLAEQESMTLGQRLDRAISDAHANGLSTTREVRVIEKRLQALEQQRRRPAA